MAKLSKQISFEKAQINLEDMTITEYLKDEVNVYNILDVLGDWNMIDGISFSLKQVDKLASNEDREED